MSLFFYKYSKNVDVSAGVSSTPNVKFTGILMHIIIRAKSDDTTFDFQLYDEDDVVIIERNDADGGINEELAIPLDGIYTLSITDSTKDEVFRIYMIVREK